MTEELKSINLTLEIPPSVNHCYKSIRTPGGGVKVILTEKARNWKLIAGYTAKTAANQQGWQQPATDRKIVLEVTAYWPDSRKHDMNNAHKLLCDALEGILYHNDKMVLVHDIDFEVDRKNPRLEICVHEKEKPPA